MKTKCCNTEVLEHGLYAEHGICLICDLGYITNEYR